LISSTQNPTKQETIHAQTLRAVINGWGTLLKQSIQVIAEELPLLHTYWLQNPVLLDFTQSSWHEIL
jgi:hypothetical protein